MAKIQKGTFKIIYEIEVRECEQIITDTVELTKENINQANPMYMLIMHDIKAQIH